MQGKWMQYKANGQAFWRQEAKFDLHCNVCCPIIFTADLFKSQLYNKKSYTSTTELKAQLIKINGSINQEILENAIKSLPGRFNEL